MASEQHSITALNFFLGEVGDRSDCRFAMNVSSLVSPQSQPEWAYQEEKILFSDLYKALKA